MKFRIKFSYANTSSRYYWPQVKRFLWSPLSSTPLSLQQCKEIIEAVQKDAQEPMVVI